MASRRGDPVQVGDHVVYAGGAKFLMSDLGAFACYDLVVPLLRLDELDEVYGISREDLTENVTGKVKVVGIKDFGAMSRGAWRRAVEMVAGEVLSGKKVLVFCGWGQGRTGMMLASLIAFMETRDETPDPIQATRERYIPEAVERPVQAAAVFGVRGDPCPEKYR